MIRQLFYFVIIGLWLGSIFSCASVGTLEGGEKDTTAPVMDPLKSTPNQKLNFIPGEIILSFDEYIKLNSPATEIVVSPPISYPLETVLRGKEIKVKFSDEEVLKKDATYSINFGTSISDYNESNKLSNFSYVFSTGAYIDSLEISGTILDAFTREPVEEVLVMLYDNLEDSVIYKERPFYFSRTDKAGKYSIKNIKNDSFQIFVLKDKNQNYYFDSETESIGFLDSLMILTDSSQNVFDLEIFPNKADPRILSSNDKETGVIKILVNQELEKIPEIRFSKNLDYKSGLKKDSLFIWYDTLGLKQFDFYLFSDTLDIKVSPSKKAQDLKVKVKKSKSKLNVTKDKAVRLVFNRPILKIDSDNIILLDTAGLKKEYSYSQDSLDTRILRINSSWLEGVVYTLIINDSTLHSYNLSHNDSLAIKIKIAKVEERGIIHLMASDLDSTSQYIIKLIDNKQNEYGKWIIKDTKEETITVADLMPIEYSYYLIEDKNRNGKWDTGNYNNKSQAEDVILRSIPKLKENWELEVPIVGTELN